MQQKREARASGGFRSIESVPHPIPLPFGEREQTASIAPLSLNATSVSLPANQSSACEPTRSKVDTRIKPAHHTERPAWTLSELLPASGELRTLRIKFDDEPQRCVTRAETAYWKLPRRYDGSEDFRELAD